jgi:hypothetical protein
MRKICKIVDKFSLISVTDFIIQISELPAIMMINDIHIIDRELDHLRSLGLIPGRIMQGSNYANIAPTALGLYMYVRCMGSSDSPVDYFGLQIRG